jgi:hypothetical protein
VRPLARCGDPPGTAQPQPGPVAHRWRFVTSPERTVRVLGQAGAGALSWEPGEGEGRGDTYAYFGSLPAIEDPRWVLLLDPGLPAWMSADMEAVLPWLFAYFAAETSLELPARPLLLVSSGGHDADGLSLAGGALDGLLSLAVSGADARDPSERTRLAWLRFLAHEGFHFWAGQLLLPDQESEWLSEGAAEIYSLAAAHRLGRLGEHGLASTLVGKANTCLAELAGAPLLTAAERGAYGAHYSCGPVILYLAGAAVAREGGGSASVPEQAGEGAVAAHLEGLRPLFRNVLAEGLELGGSLRTGLLLGWLDRLTSDRQTVFALQRLIRFGVPEGADRFLQLLLREAGLAVSLVPLAEAEADWRLYRSLVEQALQRCACGEGALEARDLAAGTTGRDECAALSDGSPVWRLDELEVPDHSAAAWARLRSAVLLQRPVRVVVGEHSEPLALLCPAETLANSFESLLRLD